LFKSLLDDSAQKGQSKKTLFPFISPAEKPFQNYLAHKKPKKDSVLLEIVWLKRLLNCL